MCFGVNFGPSMADLGTTAFGFAVGDCVEVKDDRYFSGWRGEILNFKDGSIAVELNEPPEGHSLNGQWFRPEQLRHVLDGDGLVVNRTVLCRKELVKKFLQLRDWDGHKLEHVAMHLKISDQTARYILDLLVAEGSVCVEEDGTKYRFKK